jgi:citrate lyase subunit beta/citryl-CoA lyase
VPQLAIIVTENATGVLRMRETMAAVPGLAAAFWDSEDLSSDLGAVTTLDEKGELLDVFRVARSLFLLEATHALLPAVDTPFLPIKDLNGLRRESIAAARTGFSGKQAIHPDHIAIINEAFSPTAAELGAAERMLAAFGAMGGGAVLVDGAMADPPHLRRARKTLARARIRNPGEQQ